MTWLKSFVLIPIMTGIVMFLGIMAFSPERTLEFIQDGASANGVELFHKATDKHNNYWDEMEKKANEGDVEAIYHWANNIRYRWVKSDSLLLPPDSILAKQWFKKGADAGHVLSKLTFWQMDGADQSELVKIADDVLSKSQELDELENTAFWVMWSIHHNCSENLLPKAEAIGHKLEELGSDALQDGWLAKFREVADNACNEQQS